MGPSFNSPLIGKKDYSLMDKFKDKVGPYSIPGQKTFGSDFICEQSYIDGIIDNIRRAAKDQYASLRATGHWEK